MEQGQPIRVISTRGLRTESILFAEQKGWELEVCPMIETIFTICPEQIIEIFAALGNGGSETILVFSSMNAVRALDAGCKKCNLVFPPGVKACFVGEKTAESASELLQTKNVLIAGNADELVAVLDYSKGETVLFVSGQNRLNTIPEGLKKKGYLMREFQVYRTLNTPVEVEGVYDAVLFFSPSAVESFFNKNTWVNNASAVSVGKTTAEALKSFDVKNIVIAGKPGEIEMMHALASFIDANTK